MFELGDRKIETDRVIRWLVIVGLGLATAGMFGVSLRANYLFGSGFRSDTGDRLGLRLRERCSRSLEGGGAHPDL